MTTPITLCGFAVSNYYNKVKLSLLEKGVPFSEALVYPSQSEEMLSESPMGKVPFLRKGPVPGADRTCRVAPGATRSPPLQRGIFRRHGVR